MDHRSFDSLTRSLAVPKTRRGLLGSLAAVGAGLLGARAATAQVSQAQCGNKVCESNPAVCTDGCVCCAYSNGNSRCRPPGQCAPGEVRCPAGQVLGPSGVCVAPTTTTTTTAPPTTTTTTTTTTTAGPLMCGGAACAPRQDVCLSNGTCAELCAGGGTCPTGCTCDAGASIDNQRLCLISGLLCSDVAGSCTATEDCGPGYVCRFSNAPSCTGNRCTPLCTVT